MGKYWAIGEVISTDHPKLRRGDYVGLELNKKWPEPYTVFYLVEEDGKARLAYARLRWVKFYKFPKGLSEEERMELGKIWLKRAIEEREKQPSLQAWISSST